MTCRIKRTNLFKVSDILQVTAMFAVGLSLMHGRGRLSFVHSGGVPNGNLVEHVRLYVL